MSEVVDTMMNIKSKLSNLSVAKLSLPSWAIPKRSTSQETPAIQASGPRQASSSRSYTQNEDLSQVVNEPVYKPMKPPTPAEVLISLEAAFFTEDFDALSFVMDNLPPDGCTSENLRMQEEVMLSKMEVASAAVNARVLENHSDFIQGMALVSELQSDLTCSHVVVRNGRRFLSRAHTEVHANLRIAALNRKKSKLMQVLEICKLMQVAYNIEESMRDKLAEDDFMEAIMKYIECHSVLEQLQGLACQGELRVKLIGSFKAVMERLDHIVKTLCTRFTEDDYLKFFQAYQTMFEICPKANVDMKALGEKLQESFAAAVDRETDGVLLAYALTMDSSDALTSQAAGTKRIQYKEMCRHLPAQNFHPCLCKTLEVLFNLLQSHYQMMTWHAQRAVALSAELQSRPNAPERAQEQSLAGDAATNQEAAGEQYAGGAQKSEESGAPDEIQDPAAVSDAARQQESATCQAIATGMHRQARTVWEMAAMRVGALLNAPSAPDGSHFLQVLQLTQKFIAIGEAFTGIEAVNLRGHVAKTTSVFFAAKQHRQLEVLRMMMDRELWQRMPVESIAPLALELRRAVESAGPSASSGSHHSLLNAGASSTADVSLADGGAASLPDPSSAAPSTSSVKEQSHMFCSWMARGNPFTETQDVEESREEPVQRETTRAAAYPDEDEEDEELHGDSIDEESQSVTKCRRKRANSISQTNAGGLSGSSPTVTAASVHVLRCLAEYIWLTKALGAGASMVFSAICHLFYCYFVYIFRTFGKPEALSKGSFDLTPRLQQTLTKLSANSAWAASGLGPQPSPGGAGPASDAHAITCSGNMYGLKERCVAAESLHTVAEELKRARPVLESHLGSGCQREVDLFYSRTVDAVEDLREHIYKEAACLLLNLHWLPDQVGDSEKIGSHKKYDRKEVGMQHNPWVDHLINELNQFIAKVMVSDVSQETIGLLWEYASQTIATTLVLGFARVRKCTEMGRACMTLDLQVIVQWLQSHMDIHGREPNLRIVDNYIKAFYVPDKDLVHWAMTHPEYTIEQIIALVNQIATAYNWKRSQRSEILAQIEEALR